MSSCCGWLYLITAMWIWTKTDLDSIVFCFKLPLMFTTNIQSLSFSAFLEIDTFLYAYYLWVHKLLWPSFDPLLSCSVTTVSETRPVCEGDERCCNLLHKQSPERLQRHVSALGFFIFYLVHVNVKPLHGIMIMMTIAMYNGIYLLLEGSSSNTMILLYLVLFVNVLTRIVNFPHNKIVHENDLFVKMPLIVYLCLCWPQWPSSCWVGSFLSEHLDWTSDLHKRTPHHWTCLEQDCKWDFQLGNDSTFHIFKKYDVNIIFAIV